jgi:hypothetical protein
LRDFQPRAEDKARLMLTVSKPHAHRFDHRPRADGR